jgi:NAD(P)-dependent dehydrogenase (short-subunit alcohol dehydrogenase family)
MERVLEDKVVVVTGGAKGLGRGSSMAVAQRGAKVVIGGRDKKAGEEIVEEIRKTTNADAKFVEGDLTQVSACKALIDTAVSQFGRIDGLINYAGILPSSDILETEESMFDDVFGINIKAPFFCTKYAVASMLRNGGGSIVNIGSLHGYGGQRDRAAYACSKGALLALTKHIAKNYAKERIRANWITMGWVATPGELALRHQQGLDMEWLEEKGREVMPMGRLQTVEDNIAAIILLLSDESSQLTGAELHISGGFFI